MTDTVCSHALEIDVLTKERSPNSPTSSVYNGESTTVIANSWRRFSKYDAFSAGSVANYAGNSIIGKPQVQACCEMHNPPNSNSLEPDNVGISVMMEDSMEEMKKKFEALIQESVKEVRAASTAANNLGFTLSQEIKGIFKDLDHRLQDAHVHFMQHVLSQTDQQGTDSDILARKDEMIASLTDMLNKERSLNEIQKELGDSRVESILNKQHLFKMTLAGKYSDHKVKQSFFNKLRSNMLDGWKQNCEAEARKKADDTCRKLGEHYKGAIDKLNERIEVLKATQLMEKTEYEATVQEGLMRGLRSLNLEALKVLNMRATYQNIAKMTWDTPSDTIFYPENASATAAVEPEYQGDEPMVQTRYELDQFICSSSLNKPMSHQTEIAEPGVQPPSESYDRGLNVQPPEPSTMPRTPCYQIIRFNRKPMGLLHTDRKHKK